MNKKFLLPLILFLALSVAFLVQLARNSQGDDPKKLESALIGKTVPSFNLESVLDEKQTIDQSIVKPVNLACLTCGQLGVRLVMPNTNT